MYLFLENNRAIAYGTGVANHLLYKSSRIQKWQMFSESDRRGIIPAIANYIFQQPFD
ncbi:MAG: hypothetical protein KME32_30505 [Mojavia pulchra JT2-VF2]|uniref:Uncharacterized protein n=1 Tax=Mojavia pulchra JT2-VF2 TaxID=287848 RepID=A0A951Q4U4_9NOST|nr:hypothetical protein [Mojavia pulchra JT2-VF2]